MIIQTEDYMANTQTLISEVYSAFNQRNIDGALALMRESVSWPKASERGRVIGKEDVLSDSEVWHAYTIADGLIERMDLGGIEADSEQSPCSSFSHR
jgi:hypothetical protein